MEQKTKEREPVLPTLQQQDRYLQSVRSGSGLDKHFQFFNDLLKLKHGGYTKVGIMLVVAFFYHFLTVAYQYKKLLALHYSTEETVIDQILNACEYVNIIALLRKDQVLSLIIFIVALCFTCGISLLYGIIYLLGVEYKPRKKFLGKGFVLMCDFQIWILYYPSLIACFEFCICNDIIGCQWDGLRYIGVIFGILGLFCGLMNQIILCCFMHNNWENKKDSFNCENPIYLSLFQISRFLLAFFVVYTNTNYTYFWFFLLIPFILWLGFLQNVVFYGGFLAFGTKFTRQLFISLLVIIVCELFGGIIDELNRSNQTDQTMENSSVYFIISLIFFGVVIIYNLQNNKVLDIKTDVHQLSQFQLIKQIYTTQAFLEISLSDISIDTYFKGILQRHLDFECQHTVIKGEGRCFCKKKKIFDSKKKKEIRIDEWLNYKAIIVKFLIKSWIEVYLNRNQQDIDAQILYARFIFNKFNNHQVALQILLELEKKFTFILQRYQSFQLKSKIIKFIKHKNRDSYKGKLETEMALFVEEQIDSIKDNISEILKQNCQFWILLQQTTIDLNQMDQKLQLQFQKIDETKKLWISITNYLEYKKKWKFYYAWFTLYILNKKVKNRILDNFQGLQVNENDVFSEEIQGNNIDEDVASVKSAQINVDNDKIEIKNRKIIFDKKACILQVNDDPQAIVQRVNKQFTRIFGYTKEESVKILPITYLMPDVFSKVHPQILTDYKITGKSSTLYSQRKIYCIHKSGIMFTAWKFLKLYVDIYGQSQYVVMIRPTDFNNEKKHDYIILNNDWEINGVTKNVLNGLNLDSNQFSKQQQQILMNILLFAPKLIQFSRIAPLINEERDLATFGMMKNLKKPIKVIQPQLDNQISNASDKPKINVNMLGSSSLRQSLGKPQGMYSDIDFGSKLFNQQQSLGEQQQVQNQLLPQQQQGNERDKFLQHQMSSISDKNEFEDFNKQIGQYDKLQNLNQEMDIKAQEQIKQIQDAQFNNNYQRIATTKDKDILSEDNQSRDEMMMTKLIKGAVLLEGKINNGEQIQFRMKIPENMDSIIQYYSQQKSKSYQIKKQQDELVKQEEQQEEGKKKDKIFVKQGTQQREFRKKARLMFQKAAEMKRGQDDINFYDLIVEIYQKFLQEAKTRTYKVICTIQFLKIKDERVGIMKIISINEIVRVHKKIKERDAGRKPSFLLKNFQPSKELGKPGSPTPVGGQNNPLPKGLYENSKFVSMVSGSEEQRLSSGRMSFDHTPQLEIKAKKKNNGLGYQLITQPQEEDEKDLLIDSKAFNKMINWETFQNQFKMQQGTYNFSLNAMDNIFRKEENNKPRKFLIKTAYMTWFLRLMFVTIITLNLITYFLKPFKEFNPIISQAQRILALSQMQTTMIEAYDTLLDLLIYKGVDYSELIIAGQSAVDENTYYNYEMDNIQTSYQFIKAQIQDLDQLQTFLDQSLFYSSDIVDTSIEIDNTPLTLDSKDFFAKFVMLQHEISTMNESSLEQIQSTDPFVEFVRAITVPTLYDQLNNAVMELEYLADNKSADISQFTIIILALEGSILALGFFGLLGIIFWISQTYKAVLKIFILIQRGDLVKIIKQQRFIESQFKYLTNKDLEIAGMISQDNQYMRMNSIASNKNYQMQQNFLLENQEEEQNVNKKKEKNIIEKKYLRSLTIKLYLTYILMVILTSGASLMFFLTLQQNTEQVRNLISVGETAISDFSDSQLLLVAVKERYFNDTNYINNFLPNVQQLLIDQIANLQDTPQISDPGYGSYYQQFQSLYYDDLCQYLYNQSSITLQVFNDCQSLLNGQLIQGIVSVNQYYVSNVQDFVLGTANRFGTIDMMEVWSYNSAIDFIKDGFKVLLTTWSNDLTNLMQNNITLILVLLIVMQIFQLFVFIFVAEMYLVNQLNNTYSFYRLVYKSYMPNDIIQKEKIIRAQLIRYNIIKK